MRAFNESMRASDDEQDVNKLRLNWFLQGKFFKNSRSNKLHCKEFLNNLVLHSRSLVLGAKG